MAYNFNYIEGDEPVPGYRLLTFLGEGGFGKVWKAAAPGGTEVALKIIRLGGTQGRKEYRALQLVKLVRHPNLVPVVSFWLKDNQGQVLDDVLTGQEHLAIGETAVVAPQETMVAPPEISGPKAVELIIAMGLGDQSLFDRLQECSAQGLEGIPVEELLVYMEGAAEAIDFLNRPVHEMGSGQVAIQHCDIKPHNLMTVGGATQICDFGLSRVMGAVRSTTATAGTIAYAAPECLRDGKPSASTDQYSLAVSYFELRTGTLPYESETFAGVTNAVINGALNLSALPAAERDVICRATAQDPEKRYPTASQMVRALRQAALGHPAGTTASGTRFPLVTIAGLIVVLLACAAYFAWHVMSDGARLAVDDRDDRQAVRGDADRAAPDAAATDRTATGDTTVADTTVADTTEVVTPPDEMTTEQTAPGKTGTGMPKDSAETTGPDNVARIEELIREGRFDDAVAAATEAIAGAPNEARLFHLRGTAHLEKQAWQDAVDDFNEALGIDPKDAYYVDRGRAFLGMEQLDKAGDDFNRVLGTDRNNPEARFGLGLLSAKRGDYDQAIAIFEQLMARADAPQFATRPEYAEAYLQRGTSFFIAGLEGETAQWDKAVADFKQGIRHNDQDYRLFSRLGTIQLNREEWAEAVKSFTASLDIDESDIDYVNRGRAYQELDRSDDAVNDFRRAVVLNASNGDAHYLLGRCYRKLSQYDAAIASYTSAIDNYEKTERPVFDLAHAYLYRGASHLSNGKLEDAAADYDRVLERPEAGEISDLAKQLDVLADAFAADGRFAEAIRWTQAAIERTDDTATRAEYKAQLEKYRAKQ
jgi:tetratricopeptide (TPR) repeat protein/serine/threonine protein kinase